MSKGGSKYGRRRPRWDDEYDEQDGGKRKRRASTKKSKTHRLIGGSKQSGGNSDYDDAFDAVEFKRTLRGGATGGRRRYRRSIGTTGGKGKRSVHKSVHKAPWGSLAGGHYDSDYEQDGGKKKENQELQDLKLPNRKPKRVSQRLNEVNPRPENKLTIFAKFFIIIYSYELSIRCTQIHLYN